MAKASSTNDSLDTCITCSTKYNRIRPSLCQCKHCSESFCFDCMKDHNDEIQQGVARAIDQYNEVKDFLKNKREWIKTEAIKSKEQINEWLTKYINDLKIEKERFDMDIDKEQKQAQQFVDDIEAQLHTCSSDIEGLTKNSRVESAYMKTLLEKLAQLTQPLSSLTIMKEYDLPSTMPKYQHKFQYSSQSSSNESKDRIESTTNKEPKAEGQNQSDPSVSDNKELCDEGSYSSQANEETACGNEKFEPTSYVINCMASDGINIMYSTIEDSKPDFIAYCYLNPKDVNYRLNDPYRPWLLSPIVDMIFWKSIGKFVCATENKIFTVEYHNKRFKNFASHKRTLAKSTSGCE